MSGLLQTAGYAKRSGSSFFRTSCQGSSEVEQGTHKPLVAGSIPAPGTPLSLPSPPYPPFGRADEVMLHPGRTWMKGRLWRWKRQRDGATQKSVFEGTALGHPLDSVSAPRYAGA
jgi:hypothetical protein